MAKDVKKYLLVAQEIKLVKILAGNNKKLRDRTIKRLSKWLNDRTTAAPLTEEALMRIWKGLFYAMWMSDKPLIQEDCAEKISNLIHLDDINISLLFFKCFLQTMVNEWYGIDNYRVDKFLMLIRRVLRQTLAVLNKFKWQNEHITHFREIINQTALKIDKNTALGLCLHLDDIFLEELAKVSNGKINSNQLLELIQPFAQQLARVDDKRQLQQIINQIFKHLIHQSDLGIEYRDKFQAWKRQGFPGGNLDAMELINDDGEPLDEEDGGEDLEDLPKDPRAGKVDVVLPQLKFDPKSVAKLLESLKYKKYTTAEGRKAISKLIKLFDVASNGVYPLGLRKISLNETKYKTSVKKSVKDLQNFENSLTQESKKAKTHSLRQKKVTEIVSKQIKDKTNKTTNNKGKKSASFEEFIQKSEGHLFANNLKRKLSQVDSSKKKPLKKLRISENESLEILPIKSQAYFKRNSGMWQVDEIDFPQTPETSPKKSSEWEKPLKNGETEIFVVSKKAKKKVKRLVDAQKRPVDEIVGDYTKKLINGISNKHIVKNPFSELKSNKTEKKIKFSNKIQAQEFKEHQKIVLKSPVIPYDASRMPSKSLLKPSPCSSPINPFYKVSRK